MRTLPLEIEDSEIQPWHSLGGVEHVCELRKSCVVLYGIFTEVLRSIYTTKDGRLLGTPDVAWSPKSTEMWIDSELRWEDEHPEVRPAIYVQLSPIQYQPIMAGQNDKTEPADRFGETHYEHVGSGQVTFLHVASTVGEACSLADNTEYELTMLQDPICGDFCFKSFVAAGRTPIQKLQKEASDKYASAVTFSYEFYEAWDVKEECPVLKSIDITEIEDNVDSTSRQDTVKRDNISAEHKASAGSR